MSRLTQLAVLRLHRRDYLLHGLLPLANMVALALYGLDVATRGGGEAEKTPLILFVIACLFVESLMAAVGRGRDLGLHPAITLMGLWISGPLLPLALGALCFLRGKAAANAYGPPPPDSTPLNLPLAAAALVLPWVIVIAGASLLRML